MKYFIISKFLFIYLFMMREREREAETQAEGETGSMHREPDVGFDPGSPGSGPGPKAGATPLHHPGIPFIISKYREQHGFVCFSSFNCLLKTKFVGSLGGAVVWRLPLAQGRSWSPGIESHIGLPVHGACFSLCLCLCLSLSLSVTIIKKKKN